MSLNFGFSVGVRSGHHRHPNTVEVAELLQECIHLFGPLCISLFTYSGTGKPQNALLFINISIKLLLFSGTLIALYQVQTLHIVE